MEEDGWQGGPFPDFYHSTFHTPWYVFAHWSRWFRILAYLPRHNLDFHDTVVLQRYQPDEPRVVTLPPALEPMEATESGEPAPAPAFDDGLDELLARAHELAAQPDPSVRRGPLRSRLRAILRPGSCHRQRALDDHLLGIVERLARRR